MPAGLSPSIRLELPSLSADPWTDRACRDLLEWSAPRILSGVEPRRPVLLFLGGSASLGEAAGWNGRGGRFLLSDLDLAVVTKEAVAASERDEILTELNGPGGPAPRLSAGGLPVTVGFYVENQIARQAPTPGLVDLRTRALTLWGPAELLSRFRAPSEDRIPRWEAFRLIGNRALELLAAPGPVVSEDAARARRLHALGKAMTGLWTSQLILEGRYRIGWRARAALLPEPGLRVSTGSGSAKDLAARAAAAWTAFLEAPGEDRIPPAEDGAAWYHAALAIWMGSAGGEAVIAREPCSARDRVRRIRQEIRRRDPRARALSHWLAAGRDFIAGPPGTPEGRRMAAAVLYWHLLPERPEPAWGIGAGGDPIPALEWDRGMKRLLGAALPAGPGCRRRLERALGIGIPPD